MLIKTSKSDLQSDVFESSDCVNTDRTNRSIGMPKVVSKLIDGRIVQSVEFVETPLEELNKGLKVDDFAIEVLLNAGYQPHRIVADSVGFHEIDEFVENVNV